MLLLLQSAASAQYRPKVEVVPVEGRAVIHVSRRPAVSLDDFDRASVVAGRLQALIQRGVDPAAIGVVRTPRGAAVVAGDTRIIEVLRQDAKRAGGTPEGLARVWALKLRELIALPGLTAVPSSLLVPLGEARSISVGGGASGPIEAVLSSDVATALVDSAKRVVTVTGASVGDCVLTLRCEGAVLDVPVSVRKYAARVGKARVAYTGSGPSRETLARLIERYAYRALVLEPGAQARLDGPVPLPAGGPKAEVNVPVRVEGEGYIPVKGVVPVAVERESLGSKEAFYLYYSNNPEQVRRLGTLFAAPLERDRPARLLYHHQNMMGRPFDLSISLANYGSAPAMVHVIEAAANPQVDTVQIGHRAVARFLPSLFSDSGYILDLDPGERYLLLLQNIVPKYTASGIYQLRLLSGDSVWTFVRADEGWSIPAQPPQPSRDVYDTPKRVIEQEYAVGGRWAFISIGKHAIRGANHDGVLYGNYGVLYDIRVKAKNPTDSPVALEVLFEPSAGIARGVFWIDGSRVETEHLLPPREYPLVRYQLEPGASRDIRILTMPLAGSNYPATVIVRAQRNLAQRQPSRQASLTRSGGAGGSP
ncbi:MAG: hypothetical protein ACUVRO_11135 [Armatimonadota bacterium]